ncbi:uncharacterized protein LTHEOB_9329 [Lasiodiplodia theobromae]|uniref:uncharacterized protein n=1 Tax=Lasiodiplodia theobromae TaxID=45133 RepID=UPI0015C30742|nr:uncharacterized protein LTHEOB_9329 [Lasiodiplodia theobromae]KAF4540233.1 hypothetical protein LTHEOB_9329 [Lasiodiplodia theobromae]
MAHRLNRDAYTVGWVCALPIELIAAQEMLDEEHDDLPPDGNDSNIYTLGSIGEHNVVIACLPAGQTGTNSAAAVAMQMKSTFRAIRFGLMVGIGGGVPSSGTDIRLGDVVVSQPAKGHGGVIQYDFGKSTPSGFERTGFLNTPPPILLSALTKLQARYGRAKSDPWLHMLKLSKLPQFSRDQIRDDVLFDGGYNHVGGGNSCMLCDDTRKLHRNKRAVDRPEPHYGTIASGNQVMRDGATRDQISSEFGGVMCFEMEAAGLMNNFPCLVIRGICDYADSHKNKEWQPYAAGTAAAYAKELLLVIPAEDVKQIQTVDQATRDCQTVAISGLGGVGKTQVALQFAYAVKEDHPEFSVFWVQASKSEDGLTVFTTRHGEVAQSLAGNDVVEIWKMTGQEAVELFEKSLLRKSPPDNHEIVIDLLHELEYLPLAITQAAAYINTNRIPISDYLLLLKSTDEDAVIVLSRNFDDKTRYPNSANAVAKTWTITFNKILEHDRLAADLLAFISCIEWKAIPYSILPTEHPQARLGEAIGTLCAYSFLERRDDGKKFDMHRLVHLATGIWVVQNGLAVATSMAAIKHLSEVFPKDDWHNRETWRDYLPHVARIDKNEQCQGTWERSELCLKVGRCLQVDGRINEAVLWLQESCEWRDRNLAEDNADRLLAQHVLAIAYHANGQVKEAAELLERVVAIEAKREHSQKTIPVD